MRLILFVLIVFLTTACSGFAKDVAPCIEDYCLVDTLVEFKETATRMKLEIKTEESLLGATMRLKEPLEINGMKFDLEFSETRISQEIIATSMTLVKKMKTETEQNCEAYYTSTLDYMSLQFGPFHPMESFVPDDYEVQQKRTEARQQYRRIQSPRGQITFQSKIADPSVTFDLKVLGPVFTAYRRVPDCNILIWFQSN